MNLEKKTLIITKPSEVGHIPPKGHYYSYPILGHQGAARNIAERSNDPGRQVGASPDRASLLHNNPKAMGFGIAYGLELIKYISISPGVGNRSSALLSPTETKS